MIDYSFSKEIQDGLDRLKGATLLNIFLGKSGMQMGSSITIKSGKWLSLIFQLEKKYIHFEFNLMPLFQVDSSRHIDAELQEYDKYPPRDVERIMNAIAFERTFQVKTIRIETYSPEVENSIMNTVRKISFFSMDDRSLEINLETESPGGFEIYVTPELNLEL